jgi:hypothetical protein
MEYVVDKHLTLDKPFMSDLQSTQPRPIKVTNPISNSNRADVKALENAKTGKVTVVVAVMHLYGNAKSKSIDSLTTILVWAETKTPALQVLYGRNSTILGSSPNTGQPTNITTMVSHLPLLQRGFNELPHSDAWAAIQRG